jgi:3D-(3,5/4)-trihydroxycyclohexane-1,2-dione acylhydrolase (decyclizing)
MSSRRPGITRKASSNRPFVIAGGGVIYSNAEEALATFAGEMGAPVAETFGGKGAVQGKAWWAVGGLGVEGNPAANALAAKADVVLSVGSRLTDFATGSQSLFQGTDVRFASINVSDHDASKQGALPIVADARLALMALAKACGEAGARTNPEWEAEVRSVVGDWEGTRATAVSADDGELLSQGQLIGLLQESSCSGDILIAASGSPPGDLLKVWDATDGRECHLEFGYSCMGYEVPATLGVRMARPHGEVVALVGDGAF